MKSSEIGLSMGSLIAAFLKRKIPNTVTKFLYWEANCELAFNSMQIRGSLEVSEI